MIKLNLLPPLKKKALHKKRSLHRAQRMVFYSLFAAVVIFTLLWGNNFLIKENLEQIQEQKQSAKQIFKTSEGGILDQKIEKYNTQVKDLYGKLANYTKYSAMLADFAQLVPEGIQITYWGIDNQTKNIELRGKAPTRDNLVNFKKNLQNDGDYASIDIPITSFLQKTDLDFRINMAYTPSS